jgi:predicted lactoylglutathione lyase
MVGDDNFIMHFFLTAVLETNVKMKVSDSHAANEIIFTLSAESREQTDEWAKEVVKAGGTIVSEPEAFGAGYYGFVFADPDGHKFNVFYM